VVGLLCLVGWLLGLADLGVWSSAELPVFDRARAAMGVELQGLERSPWLPDRLRTLGYAMTGSPWGARIPQALASAMVVTLVAGLCRRRGDAVWVTAAATLIAFGMPATGVQARTMLGNPFTELFVASTLVLWSSALEAPTHSRRLALGSASAASLALSISAGGLVLGGIIPLLVIAVVFPLSSGWGRVALWLVATAAIGVALALAFRQGEGYIPLLGAAKDLDLVAKPQARRFAAAIEDITDGLFPWAGLVAMGATLPRARPYAMWLGTSVVVYAAWSLVYGAGAVPVVVPASLCAAAAIEALTDRDTKPVLRRLLLLGALAGAILAGKDASLWPSRFVAPAVDLDTIAFPAESMRASERLASIERVAIVGLLVAAVGHRAWWVGSAIGFAALFGGWMHGRVLLVDAARGLSLAEPLGQHARFAKTGALPEPLGIYRVHDPGLAIYGPPQTIEFPNRDALVEALLGDAPSAALVRSIDVPEIHRRARGEGRPFFVLDRSHATLRLVANVLPLGARDLNQIPEVVTRERPQLRNDTLVRFGNYVEIVGWELDGSVIRGRDVTLTVAIRVLRPLPARSRLYTRLVLGRLALLNREAEPLLEDIYPCTLWTAGDYILHRLTFRVPVLESPPGSYAFVVGMRRGENDNYPITVPPEASGEFGVTIRDRSHTFANLGMVDVW